MKFNKHEFNCVLSQRTNAYYFRFNNIFFRLENYLSWLDVYRLMRILYSRIGSVVILIIIGTFIFLNIQDDGIFERIIVQEDINR